MPIQKNSFSSDRCNFEGSVSSAEIASVVKDRKLEVLQTSTGVSASTWRKLNDELFAKRPDIELRLYGFYDDEACDLGFLHQMTKVRHFSADCLRKAINVESICALKDLRSLAIGIYHLDTFEFLRGASRTVQELSLMATKSKKPHLEILRRFPRVKKLYIEGQSNGIETIADLKDLQDLTLRSVSPKNLDFLTGLKLLRSVDLKLGGITNLDALGGMDSIRYLELWQIKGLSDISVVGEMLGLQYLFLQSLKNVKSLPDLSRLKRLRRVYLENMKGVKDLSPLATAPALEEFAHAMANGSPDDYSNLLGMRTLKKASVWFGSEKKNVTFRTQAKQRGVKEYTHGAFAFRK